MLELKNISKDYVLGKGIDDVHALKDISIAFRENEFVSILGPSGCGKTTLLNIIGGLDRYTKGDLIINGKSTKDFSDHDWDVYRNHHIGFVFQSYNLIPHQTVLGNVELALNIAGISKEERTKKAKETIDRVGLKGLYNKKPNQLSGGQCQRVAIARALVNEPDILLADEPTGALDTQTSIQIMELIKEISKDKLVIMVTHNPDLAEKYSTRIVKLLDGNIEDDSNPYTPTLEEVNKNSINKNEDAKMSFASAFALSFKNLISKKGRTLMTSIASSIGIIGVSLVLAISTGITTFVDNLQEDMLSGNPIVIEEETIDINQLMQYSSYGEKAEVLKENGWINVDSIVTALIERSKSLEQLLVTNDINEDYIEYLKNINPEILSAIQFTYGINVGNNIYTDFRLNNESEPQNMSVTAISGNYTAVLQETEYAPYASYITSLQTLFYEEIDADDYVLSQYDIKAGKLPNAADEIVVVIDENTALTDLVLTQLGYYTQDEFLNIIDKATEDPNYDPSLDKDRFKYEEILNKSFTYYPNDAVFNEGTLLNPFTYNAYSKDITDKSDAFEMKIVGILQPKENVYYGSLRSGFYYTKEFAEKFLQDNLNSKIAQYLVEHDGVITNYRTETNMYIGVTYDLTYNFEGVDKTRTFFVESSNPNDMFASFMGGTSLNVSFLTLRSIGGNDLPNHVAIYPVDFNLKEKVLAYLDEWNSENDIELNGRIIKAEDRSNVTYTDALSIVISMIKTMINIITIALIVFTALSLVVSSVMIGIITYVSVVERTKEIGVIRSLGGRKRDVGNLFRAETFIIGFASGLIGIIITMILAFLLSIVIKLLVDVYPIAFLPWYDAVIMVTISVALTGISGIIPAEAAAKKDPVVALRTE